MRAHGCVVGVCMYVCVQDEVYSHHIHVGYGFTRSSRLVALLIVIISPSFTRAIAPPLYASGVT